MTNFSKIKMFVSDALKWVQMGIQRYVEKRKFFSSILIAAKSGRVTEEEVLRIQARCKELKLTLADLKTIRAKVFDTALRAVEQSGTVTAKNEAELNKIQQFLMIPESEISGSKQDLSRLRMIAEIHNGNPPILSVSDIILQKGELAHWSEPASILEVRVTGKRYEGGSSGFSFRIAKGVSYRVGSHRGRLITDKALLPVSSGELIMTSKRIIFKGSLKSFDVRLDKVLGVNFADDGLIFNVGNREKPYVVQFDNQRNIEIIRAIFQSAMKKLAA